MTPIRCLAAVSATTLMLLAAPHAAASQEFKRGTYATTFNGMALEIQFADSGKVTVTADNAVVVTGTFTIKGEEIELRDQSGPLACNADQVGRYKWKLEAKTLTLLLISDDCQGRTQSIAGQPWTWRDVARP
jgi:type IV secretory pathway protease TraF